MRFSHEFFSVTAQVIPVVLLALALEDKLRDNPKTERPSDRLAHTWLMSLLVMSEVLCLAVVAGGLAAGSAAGWLVSMFLATSALAMLTPVVVANAERSKSKRESGGHGLAILFLVGVVIFVVVASLA